jgi:hypothetical protein
VKVDTPDLAVYFHAHPSYYAPRTDVCNWPAVHVLISCAPRTPIRAAREPSWDQLFSPHYDPASIRLISPRDMPYMHIAPTTNRTADPKDAKDAVYHYDSKVMGERARDRTSVLPPNAKGGRGPGYYGRIIADDAART